VDVASQSSQRDQRPFLELKSIQNFTIRPQGEQERRQFAHSQAIERSPPSSPQTGLFSTSSLLPSPTKDSALRAAPLNNGHFINYSNSTDPAPTRNLNAMQERKREWEASLDMTVLSMEPDSVIISVVHVPLVGACLNVLAAQMDKIYAMKFARAIVLPEMVPLLHDCFKFIFVHCDHS